MIYLLALLAVSGPSADPILIEIDEHTVFSVPAFAPADGRAILYQETEISLELDVQTLKLADGKAWYFGTGQPGTWAIVHKGTTTGVKKDADGDLVYIAPQKQFRHEIKVTIKPRAPPAELPEVPETPDTPKAVAANYLYESEDMPIPLAVDAAARQINSGGSITFRMSDPDVKTGVGAVPRLLAKSIETARQKGTPIIVMADNAGEVVGVIHPVPDSTEAIVREVNKYAD